MLQILEERSKKKTKAVVESKGDDNVLWIRKIVATVSSRPLSDIAIEDLDLPQRALNSLKRHGIT